MINAIKTYLINLDRNPERLKHMQAVLGGLGIEYERIAGVDGRLLSAEEKAKSFNARRSYIANKGGMSDGEIGCALSHVKVYRAMVEAAVEVALILEDDIKLSPDIGEALVEIKGLIDVKKPQVVSLSCLYNNDKCAGAKGLVSQKSMCSTDGYVITLPAAKAIIKENYPVKVPSDKWRRFSKYAGVKLFRFFPPKVAQVGFASTIINRHESLSGVKKRWLYLEDWFLSRILGR